jgi:hypothetical protein
MSASDIRDGIDDYVASRKGIGLILIESIIIAAVAGVSFNKSWWIAFGAFFVVHILFMIPKVRIVASFIISFCWGFLLHMISASFFPDSILWKHKDLIVSSHAIPWFVGVVAIIIAFGLHLAAVDD